MNPFWTPDMLPSEQWKDHWQERVAILIENRTPEGEAEERALAEVIVLFHRENQAEAKALLDASDLGSELVTAELASRKGP